MVSCKITSIARFKNDSSLLSRDVIAWRLVKTVLSILELAETIFVFNKVEDLNRF